MTVNLSYRIIDETSSVVSGLADPATVSTATDQVNYLLSTLKSAGSMQILDQYRLSVEWSSSPATSGTANGGSSTTLTVSGTPWTANQWVGYVVKITGGTGTGEWRQILSNTNNTLTVDDGTNSTSPGLFTTFPDNTSQYQIVSGILRPGTLIGITPQMTGDAPVTFDCNIKFLVGTTL